MDTDPAAVPDERIRRTFGLSFDMELSEEMLQQLREQYVQMAATGALDRMDRGTPREVSRSQLNAALDDVSQPCEHCGAAEPRVSRASVMELLRLIGVSVVD